MKLDLVNYLPVCIPSRKGIDKPLCSIKYRSHVILNSKKCRTIDLKRNISLSDMDFIAIGIFLAEGGKSERAHSGELTLATSEPLLASLFFGFIEKFGIDRRLFYWNIDLNINYKGFFDDKNIFNYWVNKCNLNSSFVRSRFLRYRGYEGCKVPKTSNKHGCVYVGFGSVIFRGFIIHFINNIFNELIVKKKRKELSLILKGYFAGDGHVNYSKELKCRRKQVEFLCNDKNLRRKLRIALQVLGLENIKETCPIKTKTHSYALRIYNRKDFLLLSKYEVLSLVNYKRKTFDSLLNTYKP